MVDAQLLLAIAPLAVLGGLLQLLAAIDLIGRQRDEVIGGSKVLWAVVLLAVPIGPIAYLWLGRDWQPKR